MSWAIVLGISSILFIGCMAICPDGVGVFFGQRLVPFGVCLGKTIYNCNDEGTAVMADVCFDGLVNQNPSDMTMFFSNFTCNSVETCEYWLIYDSMMDTEDIETCESANDEDVGFGDNSNCEPTDCRIPNDPDDIMATAYMYYPNNPYMDQLQKSHQYLINECLPLISYVADIGGWGPTGNYSYQRVYSCDSTDFSGTGFIQSVYSDENCEVLLEENYNQIQIQRRSDSPIPIELDASMSECKRIKECSDESILTPTLSPTNAPTQAPVPTQQPTDSPTVSPTPPTTAPTNAPTEQPTNSPSVSPTPPTSAPTDSPTNAPTTHNPTTTPSISNSNNANINAIESNVIIVMLIATLYLSSSTKHDIII